jgi:O-antigen/teichoic acid export membrane protein
MWMMFGIYLYAIASDNLSTSIQLLLDHLQLLSLLSISLILSKLFTGYLAVKHKTHVAQFINELFLKTYYLVLALVYLVYPFSFEWFLILFVFSYVFATLFFWIYAWYEGFRISFKLRILKVSRIIKYGAFTILDKGALIMVGNIDLIMIGILLNLENVAYYTLAFYIGTVIVVPRRAIQPPAAALVARFLREESWSELQKLYRQTSLNQLFIGSFIFVLIWINIQEIYSFIPEKFYGGIWVVLFIALSKLFDLAAGIGGAILIYSKYYRLNLVFNLILILVTIGSNYLLIGYWGINGAAIATAITFFLFNLIRTVYVYHKFKMHPFTKDTLKVIVVLVLAIAIGSYIQPIPEYPFIQAAIKSLLVGGGILGASLVWKIKAEILEKLLSLVRYKK